MATSRPSGFKKGGGFLNNVAGIIASYAFTTIFPGEKVEKRSAKGFLSLYFVLDAQVDGSEKPQQTTIFAGNGDEFEISADGKTLTPVDDTAGIRQNSDLFRFLSSLVSPEKGDLGFPEDQLPDEGEPVNFEAIEGTRVEFIQVKDDAKMAKDAKDYLKSGGKINKEGQKKGKDGKFYNQTYLAIGQVYELPGDKPKAGAKRSSTMPAKEAPATKGKKSAGPSIDELAKETLLAILNDNEGEVAKSALPQKIAAKLGSKHPQKEDIRKRVYSDEFLETEDGWTYAKSSKKQLITISAAPEE